MLRSEFADAVLATSRPEIGELSIIVFERRLASLFIPDFEDVAGLGCGDTKIDRQKVNQESHRVVTVALWSKGEHLLDGSREILCFHCLKQPCRVFRHHSIPCINRLRLSVRRTLFVLRQALHFITDRQCCDVLIHVLRGDAFQSVNQILERHAFVTEFDNMAHRRVLALFRVLGTLFKALSIEGVGKTHHAGFVNTRRVHMSESLRPNQLNEVFESLSHDLIGQQDMSLIAMPGEQPKRMDADALEHLIVLLHLFFIAVVEVQRQLFCELRGLNGNLALLSDFSRFGQGTLVIVVGIDRVIHTHRIAVAGIQPAAQNIDILFAELPSVVAVLKQHERNIILIAGQRAQLYASAAVIVGETGMHQLQELQNRIQLLFLLSMGESQCFNLNACTCHSRFLLQLCFY